MLIILSVFLQFYIYLTNNLIYFYLFFFNIFYLLYLDVLMYVPIVYGFLPEINVFVFIIERAEISNLLLQFVSKL